MTDPHTSPGKRARLGFGFQTLALTLMSLVLSCVKSPASEASENFDKGNRFYEQGKHVEAVAAYEQAAQSGLVSAPLYFNWGNALFKAGRVGQAILRYHQGGELAPRDPDIRANLRFVRQSVAGSEDGQGFSWTGLVRALTLNEWSVLAAAAYWVWLMLLIARQLRPAWQKALSGYTAVVGVTAALILTGMGLAMGLHWNERQAVVIVKEAVVRYGPVDVSKSYYNLRDGNEVRVLDRKDNWLQVSDHARRTGWLQAQHVQMLP